MHVTLAVVGGEEHDFDVEDATYAELLAEIGLSPNEVAVIVDGRPVPEDRPVESGRARVLRLVSGGGAAPSPPVDELAPTGATTRTRPLRRHPARGTSPAPPRG